MTGRIRIGHCYIAQLSKKQAPVRVDSTREDGGWNVRNLETGRLTIIKEKDKFLRECSDTDLETERQPNRRGACRSTALAPSRDAAVAVGITAPDSPATPPKRKSSLLNVAHRVLVEEGGELSTPMIIKTAIEKGYWKTNGKTPAGTLHAAISRDIAKGGDASRFAKGTRGKFVAQN